MFMLADSGVRVVVTESRVCCRISRQRRELVLVDRERGRGRAAGLSRAVQPDDLAYVIYTSGSTGKPKGVLISHHNVTRLFDATEAGSASATDDVWTLFHSYAFDFSVWEMWGALLYGGRLVVVPYWVSRSPEAFRELVIERRRDGAQPDAVGVSTVHRGRRASRSRRQRSALRYVIFGGEALRAAEPAAVV